MHTYEPVIGLEIHVELKTASKMFCGCPADHFGKKPNTQTCPVCLGLPGALPVPNKKAAEWTIMLGLALGGDIADVSKFDRKHYFYPDLPKGYQISQYDQPIARGGALKFKVQSSKFKSGYEKTVRIDRIHLEEDTGKLQHATVDGKKVTLVDFNRSGVPLVEIVTEPDLHNAEEARKFLKKLHQIVRYLVISDADMEKGSMRLEPNISLRKAGAKGLPPYKVEVKNINSFRFATLAINYEIARQRSILDDGKVPIQETRGWDEGKAATVTQRSKEEASDYRYFPEPDIPPMSFAKEQIRQLADQIGELPDEKVKRFEKEYGLEQRDIAILTETRELADYFEECVNIGKIPAQKLANWIINRKVDINAVLPARLVASILKAGEVIKVPTDLIATVLSENPKAVSDYKAGKEQALMFLMGQVKRQLPQGDSQQILEALKIALG